MLQDRIKWNAKYQQGSTETAQPSAVVREFSCLASGKKALDIAAGNGRNAVYLAQQGFVVDAVDISETGLAIFAGNQPDINPVCADLDNFDIPHEHYDLIINIKFLNRRLFPYIYEGLIKGGLLIFETFLEIADQKTEQSHRRDYLLRENELLHAFLRLNILYYKEGLFSSNPGAVPLSTLIGVKKS